MALIKKRINSWHDLIGHCKTRSTSIFAVQAGYGKNAWTYNCACYDSLEKSISKIISHQEDESNLVLIEANRSCIYPKNGGQFKHMISRICKLSDLQSFFLFGPRGSGKSTLLKSFFKDKDCLWFDLLHQKTEFDLSRDPDLILDQWRAKKSPWIVIDEIQKIPRLLDVVHKGIEDHKIKFALTGSSARKLKKGGANLLAGRAASFLLGPFSAIELGTKFDLEKSLRYGMLPQFWSDSSLTEIEYSRSLYSYVSTYLKEEIASEQLVRQLEPFRRFLICAAQMNGKIINYSKIERDAAISQSQSARHFEILVDTLIGEYLPPYHSSIRKRQTQKSKFYFFDTGVVRALNDLLEEPIRASTYEYGELFETFLMNEFFKLRNFLEKRWKFSYLRTKDDVEIDLIIEKPRGKPILIEIKSSSDLKKDSFVQFKKIADEFKGSQKFVLSNTKTAFNVEDIQCLHWAEGLRQIFEIESA